MERMRDAHELCPFNPQEGFWGTCRPLETGKTARGEKQGLGASPDGKRLLEKCEQSHNQGQGQRLTTLFTRRTRDRAQGTCARVRKEVRHVDEERRRVRKDCQVLEKGEKVGACPGHPELRESRPAKLLAKWTRFKWSTTTSTLLRSLQFCDLLGTKHNQTERWARDTNEGEVTKQFAGAHELRRGTATKGGMAHNNPKCSAREKGMRRWTV